MQEKISVYIAAALFNAREAHFNSCIVKALERRGYKTNFPQRDGFEFADLAETLKETLSQEEIPTAVQEIIYHFDMGFLLPRSDVILANLDEPIDEGVVTEISYAQLMGKPVIRLRTDIRSPYGSLTDRFKGMHFFPALQCNEFVAYKMPTNSSLLSDSENEFYSLANAIAQRISALMINPQETIPDYVSRNPNISKIIKRAEQLFGGIKNIHSKQGLETIARRY